MIRLKIIFILTVLSFSAFGQDNLYLITKGDLWGYIDETGKTAIIPQFKSAGPFSEGLAAVRLNGTYGYIDKSGSFVIKPQYDFALPFQNGLSKVFLDGKPFFVDKKGNITFTNYKDISAFGNISFATVVTKTGKCGVINKAGNLVIDTIYAKIGAFINGVAVVTGLNHNPDSDDSTKNIVYEKGVIDTLGNWKVKYGEYKDIHEFNNGYASVELMVEEQEGDYDKEGVIDETGKYKFTIPSKKWNLEYGTNFYQGITTVKIWSVDPDTIEVWSSDNRYNYIGAINTNGEIILSNTDWDELTPFSFNRAFAQNTSGKWLLINTQGQTVVPQPFDEILYDTQGELSEPIFRNGIAFVKTEKGWGAIDTTGKPVVELTNFKNVEYNQLVRRENIFFFEEDISVESDEYSYRYGFYNTTTNTLIEPTYHDIDMNNFSGDLIYAMKDGINYYINFNGDIIWQGTESKTPVVANLNIDFMNRGYFYAYSMPNKKDIGGFGRSNNYPEKISKPNNFQSKTLSVVVRPEVTNNTHESYNAIKVHIVNATRDKIEFNAQDSRLYMTVQALNSKGEWKDIEYLPSSWCGNSYHTLTLEPKHFWTFLTPIYEGDFKTKLRIKLQYIDPSGKPDKNGEKKENTIYSNEYEGSINPGQFWRKRDYYPSGIMDPYDN